MACDLTLFLRLLDKRTRDVAAYATVYSSSLVCVGHPPAGIIFHSKCGFNPQPSSSSVSETIEDCLICREQH